MTKWYRLAIVMIALGQVWFFLPQGYASPWQKGNARCYEVALRGHLNVLTINILFSEVENRDKRLEVIGDFIAHNDVDVI